VVTSNNTLWLGITVGTDNEMSPRVQLGSVPFAVQALTVPDGSITTAKLAAGAITTTVIADGAVTQAKAPTLLRGPQNGYRVESGFMRFDGGSTGWQDARINFSQQYPSPPAVFITLNASVDPIEAQYWENAGVHSVTTDGFTIKAYALATNFGVGFYWIAIGP
jgi:hypothetical protein